MVRFRSLSSSPMCEGVVSLRHWSAPTLGLVQDTLVTRSRFDLTREDRMGAVAKLKHCLAIVGAGPNAFARAPKSKVMPTPNNQVAPAVDRRLHAEESGAAKAQRSIRRIRQDELTRYAAFCSRLLGEARTLVAAAAYG